MLEKSLIITGSEAEILSQAITNVKAKAYDESEATLDDTQAFHALIARLNTTEEDEKDNETPHTRLSSLGKRLVLGTVIGRSEL